MRRLSLSALLALTALTTACGSSGSNDPTGGEAPTYSPGGDGTSPGSTPPDSHGAPQVPEPPKPDPTVNAIVRVHYPEGKGDMNLTGDVGPLSGTPSPMQNVGGNTWEVDLGVISAVSHVHPLLGDKPSLGPDYQVQPGQTLDIYPRFTQKKGTVVTRWPQFQSKIHTKVFNGVRQIQVYFPPTYIENTEARFPVVYVMDAQIYFGTSPNWTASNAAAVAVFKDMLADETMDAAADSGKIAEAIIVGVDTPININIQMDFTHDRMLELTPTAQTDDPSTGQMQTGDFGEGPHFLEMITEELKPLVDKELRTRPEKKDTYISGASLGGLMSMYAGGVHGDVFGGIVSFSGSAWWDKKMVIDVIKKGGGPFKVYADVGGAEIYKNDKTNATISFMVDDNKTAFQTYADTGYVQGKTLMTQIYPGGTHDGASWSKRVPDAFAFVLGPGR